MQGHGDVVAVIDHWRDIECHAGLETLHLRRGDGTRTAARGGEDVDGFTGVQRSRPTRDGGNAWIFENACLVIGEQKAQLSGKRDRTANQRKEVEVRNLHASARIGVPGG